MFKKNFFMFATLLLMPTVFVVLFNIIAIPRGVHLMIYINELEYKATANYHWTNYIVFASLSKFIFKNTGNYCDAPYFIGDTTESLVAGKNMTITFLIQGYSSNVSVDTKEKIYKELENALSKCNPNITGEYQPLPPIHTAILRGEKTIVFLLVNNGAQMETRIKREGKEINNMTPLEFSKFLEKIESDERKKRAYRSIASFLESYRQAQVGF
jgi:hypothetical protein